MLRTAKCKLCGFTVTKNGVWQTNGEIRRHVMREHPKEYDRYKRQEVEFQRKMLELRRQRKTLWIITG